MIEACAAIVARDDPHLHATALFAPEPARSRLMVLYAFDCELSRATRASRESMIPRMRLQWWRDVIREAAEGGEPKAHEVAGPMMRLIQSDPALVSDIADLEGKDVLSRMIAGYEAELEAPFSGEVFSQWTRDRFGARMGLAATIMPLGAAFGHDADDSAAADVLGFGLALRTAARMAADRGVCLLPDLPPGALGALARGQVPEDLAGMLKTRSRTLLDALKTLRRSRRLSGVALVSHLPVAREVRVLGRVARDPSTLVGKIDDVDGPFQGLRLAARAWRRRW